MFGITRLGLQSLLGAACLLSLLLFDRGAFQTFREPKHLAVAWIAGTLLLVWGGWLLVSAFRKRPLPLPPLPLVALCPLFGLIAYQFYRVISGDAPVVSRSDALPLEIQYYFHILLPAAAWLIVFGVACRILHGRQAQGRFLAVLMVAFTLEVAVVLLEIVQNQTGLPVNPVMMLSQGEIDVFGQTVKERIFGTIGNPNWVAGYLAIAIFPLAAGLLASRRRLIQIVLVTVLIAGLFTLASTRSKGAFLALLVGATHFSIVYLLWRRSRSERKSFHLRLSRGPVFACALLVLLAIVGGFAIANQASSGETGSYLDHWAETLALRGDSVTVRALLAHCGFQMWEEAPWTGLGPGEFKIHFLDTLRDLIESEDGEKYRVRVARLHSLRATHVHNEYLQSLIEFGVIGLISIELFFVWCQCRAFRFICKLENSSEVLLRIGFLSGVWAGFGGSLFDYPFHRPAQAFLLAVFLGIAISIPRSLGVVSSSRAPGVLTRFFASFLGLVFLTGSFFLIQQAEAKYIAQRLGFWGKTSLEIAGGDPGKAFEALATAQDLAPAEGEYTLWLAYYYLKAQGDPNLAIRQLRRSRATSDNPNRVLLEATAQIERNDPIAASRLLQFVEVLEPNKPGLHFLKGQVFQRQRLWQDAARSFLTEIQNSRRPGATRSPNLEESYLRLAGILEKQLGQYEEAAKYYKGFLEVLGDRTPSYPEARLRLGDLSLNRFYDLENAERYYLEALDILEDRGARREAKEVEKILEDIENRKKRFR